jgi:hypothetical protein
MNYDPSPLAPFASSKKTKSKNPFPKTLYNTKQPQKALRNTPEQ